MNRVIFVTKTTLLSALLLVSCWQSAMAAIYTSISSGIYSSSAVWLGGVVPPQLISLGDTVRIASGHDVVLDQDISFNHALSRLIITGTLRNTAPHAVSMSGSAQVIVAGTFNVDSFSIAYSGNTLIAGQCNFAKMRCINFIGSGGGSITITQALHVIGATTNSNGNIINIGNNATIFMYGGSLVPGITAVINLPSNYDVVYMPSVTTPSTGWELSGTGLRNVTVDVGLGNTLLLGANLVLAKGSLTLGSGTFSLNNNNLLFSNTGDLSAAGSGDIRSTSSSDIEVVNDNGLSSELRFASGGNTIDDFIVNIAGSADVVKLGSNVKITGKVDLQKGKVDVQVNKLSLITGAVIAGGSVNNYVITSGGGSLAADIGSGALLNFPVGTATQYAPCIIESKNNTIYNGITVRVQHGVKTEGTSGNNMATTQSMVNATWFVEHSNTTVDLDIELFWDGTMEANSFNRSQCYISHLYGAYWDRVKDSTASQSANGLYSIKRKNIKSLSPFAVFDRNAVGVKDVDGNSDVYLYPNPAKNVLYISDTKSIHLVEIYSMSGRKLSTADLYGNNQVNIGSLPTGNYYLLLTGSNFSKALMFVKQ